MSCLSEDGKREGSPAPKKFCQIGFKSCYIALGFIWEVACFKYLAVTHVHTMTGRFFFRVSRVGGKTNQIVPLRLGPSSFSFMSKFSLNYNYL